jgi:hypothetical protein
LEVLVAILLSKARYAVERKRRVFDVLKRKNSDLRGEVFCSLVM